MIIKQSALKQLSATPTLLLLAAMSLTACSSNNDNSSDMDPDGGMNTPNGNDMDPNGDMDPNASSFNYAFAATAAGSTGQLERISLSDGYTVNGTYPATGSDIAVATDGTHVYQIGRYLLDSLTKFDAKDTSVTNYQYSVNGEEMGSNPYDIDFVSDTKAYVVRYGSPKIWIINPSATTEDEFKLGEIDLSSYDPDTSDEDFSPNAESAIIVDGKLFVLMQRLTGFNPIETGYVAVFDTETDAEIDTGKGGDTGLKGIPLNVVNPQNIRLNAATNEIYVTGRGNLYVAYNALEADPYTGGLIAIDQTTYDTEKLLDDGDSATNNDQGFISRTLVVSDTKGYVLQYTGDDESYAAITSFHSFNPITGVVGEEVAAITDLPLTALAMGSDGYVWVGVGGDTPGFTRLDTETDMTVEPFIATSFTPKNVVFIDKSNP